MNNEEKNIRDKTLMDVVDVLTDFASTKVKEKKLKFYPGIVEDNKDPDKIGRCKIRVYGVYHEDIPTTDIPWALPDFNFIGSTIGSFIVPPPGAIVRVYFEQDDFYRPQYTTKVMDTNNLSNEKDENYPESLVFFETDFGEFFKINTATGESTYRHASGLTIRFNKEGDLTIDSAKTDSGKFTITMKGDVDLTTDGDVNVSTTKGQIKLGGSSATQPCNNLPLCLITGAPHSIGQQLPGTPGSTNVRS